MSSELQPVAVVRSPWTATLRKLLSSVDHNLLIVSPFIKSYATDLIIGELEARALCNSVVVNLITDLRPESALAGSTDLEAFSNLRSKLPLFELTHLPSVHAKVFVADSRMAVVTSGNLTGPGLAKNIEYGIALSEKRIVKEIRTDFENYSLLGAKIAPNEVAELAEEMRELKELFQKAQNSIRARAQRAFEERLGVTRDRLLRQRARGETTHAIFTEAIKFVLSHGPMTTEELNPQIQLLHPDLCDDSIDRVIGGVHFGKKWKHHVRNAQQALKRSGQIRFDGTRWEIVPGS